MPKGVLKIRPECRECAYFSGDTPENCICAKHNDPTCYRKKKACTDLATKKLTKEGKPKGEKPGVPQAAAPKPPVEKAKKAIAYTDGSYNKAKGIWGYGVLMLVGDERIELTGNGPDRFGGWQIQGETTGALKACEKAIELGVKELEIRYDYEGVKHWAIEAWRTNKPYTYQYAQDMKGYRKKMRITFSHVKGHSGESGNEAADRLAKQACGLVPSGNRATGKDRERTERNRSAAQPEKAGENREGKLNPKCAEAIRTFRKKKEPRFRDYMSLKTYGLDSYSKIPHSELCGIAEEGGYLGKICGQLEGEKEISACIRWVLRGLSVKDAIHKVKVDAEVSANCGGW